MLDRKSKDRKVVKGGVVNVGIGVGPLFRTSEDTLLGSAAMGRGAERLCMPGTCARANEFHKGVDEPSAVAPSRVQRTP